MGDIHIDQILQSLAKIGNVAMEIVAPTPNEATPWPRPPISLLMRQNLVGEQSPFPECSVRGLIDLFKRFARTLDSVKAGEELSTETDMLKGLNFTPSQMKLLYVELRTAVSLGLYFLGVPSVSLWDRVLTWSFEKGGGLPNGICVAKAIGDIVRSSRKFHEAHEPAPNEMPHLRRNSKTDLLIVSFLPMLLFRDLILWGGNPPETHDDLEPTHPLIRRLDSNASKAVDDESPTDERSVLSQSIHRLGRCYETLQLQLHIAAGYPILYAVPQEVVKAEIDDCMQRTGSGANEQWTAMCNFLDKTIVRNRRTEKMHPGTQQIILMKNTIPPACFINHDSGLLTFEGIGPALSSHRQIPLPANHMLNERHERYRNRVISIWNDIVETKDRDLLAVHNRDGLFKEMLGGTAPPVST